MTDLRWVAVPAALGGLAATALLAPESASWLCILGAVLVGVPHGAMDLDLVALWSPERRSGQRLRRAGAYLAAVAALALGWWWFPVASLLVFLAVAVLHFGDSDLQGLGLVGLRRTALATTRGLAMVGMALFADLEVSGELMATMVRQSPPDLSAYVGMGRALTLVLGVLHGSLALGLWPRDARPGQVAAETTLLVVLALVAGPLVGFSAYFVGWHSSTHLSATWARLRETAAPQRRRALRTSVLTSALGLAMSVTFSWVWAQGVPEDGVVAAVAGALVLVACLTVPHAAVVWLTERCAYQSASSSSASMPASTRAR